MPSNVPGSTPPESRLLPQGWPKDLLILALIAGSLWAITIVWIVSGAGQSLEPPIRSETDAWLFALSGAILIYFLVAGVIASWGVILGIPTCLLVLGLCLRRVPTKARMLSAGLVTTAIFLGIPMILNSLEEKRLATVYKSRDGAFPSGVGRAIELASETPRIGGFTISCSGKCLDLMTFGRADSVTRTFPKGEGPAGGEAAAQNFRVGLDGPDCAGTSFKDYCAYPTDEGLPKDRLVLKFETVAPRPADAADVYIRRLSVRDTAEPARTAAMQTQLAFARYSGLLNVAWNEGGFYLRRDARPMILTDQFDARLYRAFISNQTLDGKYHPFR